MKAYQTVTYTWKVIFGGIFLVSSLSVPSVNAGLISSQPYIINHGVNFATGNKYVQEEDIRLNGLPETLTFIRTYNSQATQDGLLGYGWSSPLTEQLIDNTTQITLIQGDGRHVQYTDNGQGIFYTTLGKEEKIVREANGFTRTTSTQTVYTYDAQGRFIKESSPNNIERVYSYSNDQVNTISDTFGRSLSFSYTDGKLSSLATPAGTFTYSYDNNGNLTGVTRPDGKMRTYLYEDPNDIHNLTGIVDETNIRVQTVGYDTEDRVTTSSLTDGAEAITIGYPGAKTRTVTDSQGTVSTYQLNATEGVGRVASLTGPGCPSCNPSGNFTYTYNSRQQITSVTDAKGTVTTFTYDSAGNKVSRTEASGTTLARTTTYSYTAKHELSGVTVSSVANPGQHTDISKTYDSHGNLLTQTHSGYVGTIALSSTTTYTYNNFGQLSSIDGPRTDVNDEQTFSYYPNDASQGNNRGQLQSMTNGLGQSITYSDYTVLGKPGTITDQNGVAHQMTYDPDGNLHTSTTGNLTTTYTYDEAGRLKKITRPGGKSVQYSYSANQIESVVDNLGNTITYSYDARGNLTETTIYDPDNTPVYTLTRTYDARGNLTKITYPDTAEASYQYDPVHNVIKSIAPGGLDQEFAYDVLNRQIEEKMSGVIIASRAYDLHDNLTNVTDGRNHTTTSAYDDFGHVVQQSSPDSGSSTLVYDAVGNLTSQTDGKGQALTFTYDALNRLISQDSAGAAREVVFTYDQATVGRLTSIQEENGERTFVYDTLGRLVTETRTLDGISSAITYTYDSTTGDLASITYPSGRVLGFSRNTAGQVTALTLDGTPLVSNIEYLPFGPVKSAQLGSVSLLRSYDQRYQVSRIQAGTFDVTYERNPAGKVIETINAASPQDVNIAAT
ncbi:MAG: hypothetical protein CSA21_00840 [Deltaproteobacteria bacterium]|nr:MAG: hypothetical protein CSA21_00840 [Deltaproteobacteria bacterium]